MRLTHLIVLAAILTGCSFDTGLHVSDENPTGRVDVGPSIIDPGTTADKYGGSEARDARDEATRNAEGNFVDEVVEDSAVGGQFTLDF